MKKYVLTITYTKKQIVEAKSKKRAIEILKDYLKNIILEIKGTDFLIK